MNDRRTFDRDRVLPTGIEHRCEEMFDGDRLTQKYNDVVYHFENGGHYHWACAHLKDIDTALPGPLDNHTRRPVAGPMGADALTMKDTQVIWSRER